MGIKYLAQYHQFVSWVRTAPEVCPFLTPVLLYFPNLLTSATLPKILESSMFLICFTLSLPTIVHVIAKKCFENISKYPTVFKILSKLFTRGYKAIPNLAFAYSMVPFSSASLLTPNSHLQSPYRTSCTSNLPFEF